MSTMKDLVETFAKTLAEKPDQVQVREIEGERTVVIELRVAPEDLGKIIGRQGRIARALRLLLTAMARKQNKRAVLEILE
ncbi:MAG: KH domain-containing protein [Gammaproteobacteria bacterium]|nr:MAG: KH domain-containing protein [Gammaproteobacteria bacterium]RTZ70582.1 MAG: KH domain-containing protein [Aquificaceae bacterium]